MRSNDLPVEPAQRRARIRRGGPRTPIPLLPLIAVGAGIGIAYVAQTAHATQTTYHVSTLAAQQQQLLTQDQQLQDELARLQSSERIVAAAQELGMRPASAWAYVASQPSALLPGSTPQQLTGSSSDALHELIASVGADVHSTTTVP